MDLDKLERTIKVSKRIAFTLVIGVPLAYAIWFGIINKQSLSLDSSFWGTFGDFVGGILNPIIAFLAFYWLTMSVLIQKTELSATQNILAETENVQREQAITQEMKRFEDSFYSLLEQMNNVYSALNARPPVFRDTIQKSEIEKLYVNTLIIGRGDLIARAKIMRESDIDCNYLFRIIYQLLKFILANHSDLNREVEFSTLLQKPVTASEKFYSNIVRSFLNKKMLHLLALNCIELDDGHDFSKFKALVERYELLEHFSFEFDWMISFTEHYNIKAFGDNPKVKNL
ncbi:putative phage abortive infection protein [Photobacterium leiognathi]|uniref:putative phage abortive infection protein n=1 Tax=Photobacterium leiognathi TaxID=553611 RepID=UPI002980C7E0|nr:putative phage abortive infection protein [Photobacterium leiognathi]